MGIAKEPFRGECRSSYAASDGRRDFDFRGLIRIQALGGVLEIPERLRVEGSARGLTRLREQMGKVGRVSTDGVEMAGDACSRE